jgi:hypothetical protein
MLTTESNAEVRSLMQYRMPVFLTSARVRDLLNAEIVERGSLESMLQRLEVGGGGVSGRGNPEPTGV